MIYGSEVFARGVKVGCYGCYSWLFRGRLKKRIEVEASKILRRLGGL